MSALAILDRADKMLLEREKRRAMMSNKVGVGNEIVRDQVECAGSLATYMHRAWSTVEVARPLAWGWVLDAVCDHLTAVTMGHIRRLIINVPPGTMKSLAVCVFWPSWEWGPRRQPSLKHLTFSYSAPLSGRDNLRCRRLIASPWYQERWGGVFGLTRDQNEKVNFENTSGGWRMASSLGGTSTGLRADRVIIDDPLSVPDSNSIAALVEAQRFTDETLPTRLVDPAGSSIVWIMQRVHEHDPVGHIMAREHDYQHLMLPMEFEPARRCVTVLRQATPETPAVTFTDPRKIDGELLFPERFPPDVVAKLKRDMGSHAWNGQAQQRPTPRGGSMLKVEQIEIVDAVPAAIKRIRAWDFAATEQIGLGDPDWTRGALCGFADGVFYVLGMASIRDTSHAVKKLVRQTAEVDGYGVRIRIPQDPGSAGKAVAEDYTRNVLPGWAVTVERETGSKIVRADPLAAAMEAGNVRMLRGTWNEDFLAEARGFPFGGGHDDQIDAVAAAFVLLTQSPAEAPAVVAPIMPRSVVEARQF